MKKKILSRHLLSLCLCLMMLLSPLANLGANLSAHAAGIDLALGKTVIVNGQISDDEGGDKAVDGDDTTKWCYTSSRINWMIVDLGGETTFDTWVLKNAVVGGESYAYDTRDILIQVSDDGDTWETVSCIFNRVGEESNGVACGKLSHPVSAFYVRLYIPYGSQMYDSQVRIYGFELYHGDYSADIWAEEFSGEANILSLQEGSSSVEQNVPISLSSRITASTSGEITWSTRETDILHINPLTGYATGLKEGTAHVTATATDGGDTVHFDVTVTPSSATPGSAVDIARGKVVYASGEVARRKARHAPWMARTTPNGATIPPT